MRKVCNDDDETTASGRPFQTWAAATGKAQMLHTFVDYRTTKRNSKDAQWGCGSTCVLIFTQMSQYFRPLILFGSQTNHVTYPNGGVPTITVISMDRIEQGLTSHSTHFWSFRRRWGDCGISQDCSRSQSPQCARCWVVCARPLLITVVCVYYLKGIVSVCFRCPANTVGFCGIRLYLCKQPTKLSDDQALPNSWLGGSTRGLQPGGHVHKQAVLLLSLQPASITSSGAFKPECNDLDD